MRVPPPRRSTSTCTSVRPAGDGFHPLLSWMVTVGLFDTLTLGTHEAASGRHATRGPADDGANGPGTRSSGIRDLTLSSDHPSLPLDGRNLVVRAATALADTVAGVGPSGKVRRPTRARARVGLFEQADPARCRLGGGSSDAAATLIGLNRLWKLG